MTTDTIRGLFFDLDHSLIRPLEGRTFPNSPQDWEFVPGVLEAIRPFMEADFVFVIISNQGGIEAGHHTDVEIEQKMEDVLSELAESLCLPPRKGYSYGYRFCSSLREHPDRKPNPGMVLKAIEEYGIDPQWSYAVGDMNTDYEAFSAAGIRHYFHIDHFIASKPTPELPLFQ